MFVCVSNNRSGAVDRLLISQYVTTRFPYTELYIMIVVVRFTWRINHSLVLCVILACNQVNTSIAFIRKFCQIIGSHNMQGYWIVIM